MAVRGRGGRFAPKPGKTPVTSAKGRGNAFSDVLTPGIAGYAAALPVTVNLIMYRLAREMEADAKEERPWNDRTTDAREGLTGFLDEDPINPTIYLSHSVYYGVYLELHFGGIYAIIMPTIEKWGPELMKRLEDAL